MEKSRPRLTGDGQAGRPLTKKAGSTTGPRRNLVRWQTPGYALPR
jgi:hypothetical protein